ncbi:spermatogenesis-associated protein 31A1-like [Rhynchonycteris naso]
MCPNAQARGTVDSVWRKYPQLRPERKQVPPESFFRKRMKLFYQWISPHGNLKSEDTLQKYRPKLATAQSQGPAKRRPLMHSKTAEAQALVTAVGQMLEDKMDIDHGLHTTKLNEHKQELQTAVCGCFCHHSAPFYPEKGRMMTYMACGHQASSNSQSCSTGEGQVRHRQPLKSAQFNDEQPDPSDLPSLSSKKALFPVSPCQYRPKVPGVLGHHQHCPRHCPFRGGVLPGQPRNASLAFPGGKTYLQEKNSVHGHLP